MKKIYLALAVLAAVFLFIPGLARAEDAMGVDLSGNHILSDYLKQTGFYMRRSGLDIKNKDEIFFASPGLITPKEQQDYENTYRDTRVPADMKKIFYKSGIDAAKNIYNDSAFSRSVDREISNIKGYLESNGLGYFAKKINPELRFDFAKDSFFTHGYDFNEPLEMDLYANKLKDSKSFYTNFSLGVRGFSAPRPKVVVGASPFRMEAEYSAGKNEIKLRLFELKKTHLEIDYTAKTSDIGGGGLEARAAIIKFGKTGGNLFFSGNYDMKNNGYRFFFMFIKRL